MTSPALSEKQLDAAAAALARRAERTAARISRVRIGGEERPAGKVSYGGVANARREGGETAMERYERLRAEPLQMYALLDCPHGVIWTFYIPPPPQGWWRLEEGEIAEAPPSPGEAMETAEIEDREAHECLPCGIGAA